MAELFKEDDILASISHAIKKEVEEAVERIADEAAEKARQEVRRRVGAIAASLISEYSFERQGNLLLIKVKIQEVKA